MHTAHKGKKKTPLKTYQSEMSMCHLAKTSKLENKIEYIQFNSNSTFHSRMRSFVSAEKDPRSEITIANIFYFFTLQKYGA